MKGKDLRASDELTPDSFVLKGLYYSLPLVWWKKKIW